MAHDLFGAEMGIGDGLTGRTYAFPTLGEDFQRLTLAELRSAVARFYTTAEEMPDRTFLLTKVGCGIAGYDEETMLALFAESPVNVVKPAGW